MQELNLSDTDLKSVPDSLCSMLALHCLCIDGTQLTELPAQLGTLPALWQLHARRNALHSLPSSLQHAALCDLDVSHNKVSEVPGWMSKLTGVVPYHICWPCGCADLHLLRTCALQQGFAHASFTSSHARTFSVMQLHQQDAECLVGQHQAGT
jgi:Leucine-rich repeat (LRR) protein